MAGQRLSDRDALAGADFANDDLVLVFDTSANTTKKMTRTELLTSISGVLPNGDKGDITVSGSGTTWTIDNNVVTYAKMQDVSAQYRLLGRSSSGAGDTEEITSSANVFSILGAADYASVRTLLSLVPGTDVQSYSAILAAFAASSAAADKLPYYTGATTVGVTDFTAFGRSLVDDANASAARTTLGLVIGTDVQAYDADLTTLGAGGAGARTFLGLTIGTDVQAYHANLLAFAGLSLVADRLPYANGTGTLALATFTAAGRALVDDADASAQRTTLGLGTAATQNTGTSGANVPLLNGTNTHSGVNTFSSRMDVGTINITSSYTSAALRVEGTANGAAFGCVGAGGYHSILSRVDRTDNSLAVFFFGSTQVGSITTDTVNTAYNTTSDYRLKENVEPISDALSVVLALSPCEFNFKALPGVRQGGFLAHEVQEIIPQAVHGEKDAVELLFSVFDHEGARLLGPFPASECGLYAVYVYMLGTTFVPDGSRIKSQGLDMSKLVPYLTRAIQQLEARVRELEAR